MRHISTGLIVTTAVMMAACGGAKSAAPNTGESKPTPTTSATATPQAPAQPAQPNQPPPPTAIAVDFETLIALLPDAPSGWTKGKPKGSQVGLDRAISSAEAEYDKGDSSIHLEITDTAFDRTYLAPLSFTIAAHYAERHGSGYSKAAPIGASPGYEKWDADAKSAEVAMVVASRIVVTATGRNVDNVDAARALVKAVDQGKLAALK